VDIGKHEPVIRSMLQNRNPGGAGDYPIFAYLGLLPDSREVAPFVVQPYRMGELEGTEIWVFVFGGCMWHFVLSNGDVPKLLAKNVLQTNGELVVPTVDTWNVKALNSYFIRHFTAAEARGET